MTSVAKASWRRSSLVCVVIAYGVSCGGGRGAPATNGTGGQGGTSTGSGGEPNTDATMGGASGFDGGGSGGAGASVDAVGDRPFIFDGIQDLSGTDGNPPDPLLWTRESTQSKLAVGGTGPNDVWAVGSSGDVHHSQGDGVWTPRILTGTGARLTGVWGTAPDNVWVSVNANIILRWTGSWQRESLGFRTGAVFTGVLGTGPNEIYAHGGSLYRSTGNGAWTWLESPPIHAFWASGPDDLWVSDAIGNLYRSTDRAVSWPQQAENIPGYFHAIWGSSPTDVYVVSGEAIGHLRGGTWVTEKQVDTRLVAFISIWGAGPSDVFVAASDGHVYRSRGDGQWYPERVDPTREEFRIVSVWGTGPRNVYLAATGGVYHGR